MIAKRKAAPLEQKQRLSRSLLWQIQRNYYQGRAIGAWSSGQGVPKHITSNPFIASAFARVIGGFFRDLERTLDAAPPGSQPIYLVELGVGHGRFGFLLLSALVAFLERSGLRPRPIRYVMTDLAAGNLDYLQRHPRLQPFIAAGILDFAIFDLNAGDSLRLLGSGEEIVAGSLENPLIVIANYVFDSVPQDAFRLIGGQLHESLVTLAGPNQDLGVANPEIVSQLEISYSHHPARTPYYEDEEWNALLDDRVGRLPDTSFLFPLVPLQALRALSRLSGDCLLLLSADKGYHSDEVLLNDREMPFIAFHDRGCFSIAVDFGILGAFFERRGGAAFFPDHPPRNLDVCTFVLGRSADELAETRLAHGQAFGEFGPDDFFQLLEGFTENAAAASAEQALALIRLSGWDHEAFLAVVPRLKELVPELGERAKREIYQTICRVWESYFSIGEETDLAFILGTLLLEMQLLPEAIEFLEESAVVYGLEPGTTFNLAAAHFGLRQLDRAHDYIVQTLELAPDLDEARAFAIRIAAAQGISRRAAAATQES